MKLNLNHTSSGIFVEVLAHTGKSMSTLLAEAMELLRDKYKPKDHNGPADSSKLDT